LSIATNKAKDKLFEYHTYADNIVDKPFLTPESVD